MLLRALKRTEECHGRTLRARVHSSIVDSRSLARSPISIAPRLGTVRAPSSYVVPRVNHGHRWHGVPCQVRALRQTDRGTFPAPPAPLAPLPVDMPSWRAHVTKFAEPLPITVRICHRPLPACSRCSWLPIADAAAKDYRLRLPFLLISNCLFEQCPRRKSLADHYVAFCA
jgi:hypothetical protein